MGKAKQVEQMIIKKFEKALNEKFQELNISEKGLDAFPIIYNMQISEIQAMRCRIKKLYIVDVIKTSAKTAIQYQITTDRGPYWYEIGLKTIPMHTLH